MNDGGRLVTRVLLRGEGGLNSKLKFVCDSPQTIFVIFRKNDVMLMPFRTLIERFERTNCNDSEAF